MRLLLTLVLALMLSGADCQDGATLPDVPTPNSNSPDELPKTCEPACGFGLVCVEGDCTPVTDPMGEIGYTDDQTNDYAPTPDGSIMPIFTFGQGGSHMFVTLRVAGLDVPPDGTLEVSYEITHTDDDSELSAFSQLTQFSALGEGAFEASRRVIFLSAFPEVLHGDIVRCSFVVTSPDDVTQSVTIEQELEFDFQQ